jgi:hypothetical protein
VQHVHDDAGDKDEDAKAGQECVDPVVQCHVLLHDQAGIFAPDFAAAQSGLR